MDNIFNLLQSFDTFYEAMSSQERRDVYTALLERIDVNVKDNEHPESTIKSIGFKFPLFSDHFINKKFKEENDINLFAMEPKKEDCEFFNTTITFGDGNEDIKLDPYHSKNEISPIASETCGINKQIIKFVKDKYNFTVTGQNIRYTRKCLGLQVRTMNKTGYITAYYVPTHERFDAIVDALISLDFMTSHEKENLDERIIEAKKNIEILLTKQKGLKYLNEKYKTLLSYIKENYQIKVDANNIVAVKSLLGFEEPFEFSNGQKVVNKIPSYDKSIIILKVLLDFKIILGDERELSKRLQSIYDDMTSNTKKRKKATNNDIIDYVKIMYGLTINNPMISYVRKENGILVKRTDSRTVESNKVDRIPKEEQYNAIVEAMKHFKLI